MAIRERIHILNLMDIMFLTSFLLSLCALTLTHYLLANGCVEVGLITGACYLSMGLCWIFALQWALLGFIYYLLRGGKLIRSTGDAIAASIFPFFIFFFTFVDLWNDLLIYFWMNL